MPKKAIRHDVSQLPLLTDIEPQVRIEVRAASQPLSAVEQGDWPLCAYTWRSYRIEDGARMAEGVGTAEVEGLNEAYLRGVVAALEYAFAQQIPVFELWVADETVAWGLLGTSPLPGGPSTKYVHGRVLRGYKHVPFTVHRITVPDALAERELEQTLRHRLAVEAERSAAV